jgi:hypothetical protein
LLGNLLQDTITLVHIAKGGSKDAATDSQLLEKAKETLLRCACRKVGRAGPFCCPVLPAWAWLGADSRCCYLCPSAWKALFWPAQLCALAALLLLLHFLQVLKPYSGHKETLAAVLLLLLLPPPPPLPPPLPPMR